MPVYVIDKPLLVTSHDVVVRARRLLGTRRVGHGGTLDPLASGVLALLSEEATKLSPFLTDSRKRYLAWVSFGATTPTLDAEGPITARADAERLGEEEIASALGAFLQLSEQVPPQYSAVKRQGVKGYEAARRGEQLELAARPARYHKVELLGFAASRNELATRFEQQSGCWRPSPGGRPAPLPEPLGAFPSALFDLEVQAGTYIRAFARDLGNALGLPAFLAGLQRTRAGVLDLAQAGALEDLANAPPIAEADALGLPKVTLGDAEAERVRMGQRLPLQLEGRTALLDESGNLVAVAEEDAGRMKLLRVWGGR